jgi:hypothetical protein
MLSLLGSLLGFGTSFLPSVLNFFKEKRDQSHELAMMDKQLEQQIAIGAQKLQMTHVDADIRESEALLKHDANLNEKSSRWVVNIYSSLSTSRCRQPCSSTLSQRKNITKYGTIRHRHYSRLWLASGSAAAPLIEPTTHNESRKRCA